MGPVKLKVCYIIFPLFFAICQCSAEQSASLITVSLDVLGLKGSNLVVEVDGESITVNTAGTVPITKQFSQGSTVSGSISSQPSSPIQLCSLVNSSITIQEGSVIKVLCQDVVNIDATSYMGAGLKLSDNNGVSISVLTGSKQAFTTPIIPGDSYSVSISQESNAPYQSCSLQNNSGTYSSSIPIVTVDCQRFFLLKQVNTSTSASVAQMLPFENGLFFQANDGENGAWFSDGTPTGTVKKLSNILVKSAILSGANLYFNGRSFSESKDEVYIFKSGTAQQLSNFNDGYISAANFIDSGETLFFERTDDSQRKLFKYQGSTFSELANVAGDIPHAVAANGGVYYVKSDGNLAVYLNNQHTSLTTGISVKEILAAPDALYFSYTSSGLYYLGKLNYSNNSYQALNSTGYGGSLKSITLHNSDIFAMALDQAATQTWRLVKSSASTSFTEFSTGFSNNDDNKPTSLISDETGLYFAALETSKPDTQNQKDLFVVKNDQITKLLDHGSGVALYRTSEALLSASGTVYFLAGTASNQLYLYESKGDADSTKKTVDNQIIDIFDDESLAISGRMLYLPVETSSFSGIQLYGYLLPP